MAARTRMRDTGGTLRTLTQIRARDGGGALRTITRIRMRDATNALRVVYDPSGTSSYSATPTPAVVFGQGKVNATTGSTTVTVTGGTAPFVHAWTVVSYDGTPAPTVNSPASATTTFTQTNIGVNDFVIAVFRDTVTDSSVPPNVTSCTVNATFADTSTL